jgi:hypothetical protein
MQLPGKILNVLPGTVILVTDEDEKQERKECWSSESNGKTTVRIERA